MNSYCACGPVWTDDTSAPGLAEFLSRRNVALWSRFQKIRERVTRFITKAISQMFAKPDRAEGYSLVELLAVVAIVSLLAVLTVPALRGFADSVGRRGTVSLVMNTLDVARVAALESGRDVYVVLCRQAAPEEDRMLVLREADTANGKYVPITKWIKLPKGMLFYDPSTGPGILDARVGGFDRTRSPISIPEDTSLPEGKGLVVMKFNSRGQITYPSTGKLWLHISEGVRDRSGGEARAEKKEAGKLPFETIIIAKYTGRAQLNVGQLSY